MEIKNFAIELKASADARTVEGMGSVFGNVDSGNDMVMPGAFAKTIKARMPAMLWQHKADQPIGVWDDVKETPQGLFVKGRILETTLGNDAYTLAKNGALTGMSIGYATKDSVFDKKTGVRQLKELELWEVSLVTFPMNEAATITRVKADADIEDASQLLERAAELCKTEGKADELLELIQTAIDLMEPPNEGEPEDGKKTRTEIERILRKAGISRNDAKGILAGGYTAMATPRKAGEQEHERLINLLNQFNV